MVHLILLTSWFLVLPQFNRKYPLRYLSFLTLFLFMALRYDYGNDYATYQLIHALINNGETVTIGSDFLFYQINYAIDNFQLLIAVISLFYLVSIVFLIKKNLKTSLYWIALLLWLLNPYLFLVHLSALRQTLAICFFIYAVYFGAKRRFLPFVLLVVMATGMHSSAIILLPSYFVLTDKPLKRNFAIAMTFILILLLFTPLFSVLLNIVTEILPEYYKRYTVDLARNSLKSTVVASVYYLFVAFNLNSLQGKERAYGKLTLIAFIFGVLAYQMSMITRVGMYFDVFLIVTIPVLLTRLSTVPKFFTLLMNKIKVFFLRVSAKFTFDYTEFNIFSSFNYLKLYKFLWFSFFVSTFFMKYLSFFKSPLWQKFWIYKSIFNI